MTFAKLENGNLKTLPGEVKIDGKTVYNPSDPAMIRALGYKEVIYPAEDSGLSSDNPGQLPEGAPGPDLVSEAPAAMRAVYTEDEQFIYVRFVPEEPAPDPDPAMLREAAYRAEADQYLIACQGYLLEGKAAEAEEQKALYLAKKAEIRERIIQ